ncbi:MAG: RND transporter [Bacteroidetes bacterium]|nr:RND transporter [Bacteroidota bacterium]
MSKGKLYLITVLACLTIGLAPHSQPHIWKQIQNIKLGRPMAGMDWLDVVMHGAPWVVLCYFIVRDLVNLRKNKS